MKVNKKKIAFIITLSIFVLALFATISFAGDIVDTSKYKTELTPGEASYIFTKGGSVLRILRNVAAVVSVITISIIGVRYMVGSVEQKAEYKQTMVPVVVGCALVGCLSALLTIIQSIF